jgi:predicted LPLAT superfamily acyltransferase
MSAIAATSTSGPGTDDRSWLTFAERGSLFWLRFVLFLCVAFGRPVARLALKPTALYYLLTNGVARRASRRYLSLVLPAVSWRTIYRHFLNFAEVVTDRVFLFKGQLHHFDVTSQGFDHLRKLQAEKRGAILLGAHLGSFEALRVLANAKALPIHILVFAGNARVTNAFFRSLNPEFAGRIVDLQPGGIDALLKVKELVDAGQMVALLGDRVGINDKSAVVEFLGLPARMPTGAYLLGAMLGCPIYLTFSLYTSPNRYECFCEPLVVEGQSLPREGREAILQAYAQRYARRLEYYCRRSPLSWFNFYDFWRPRE